MLQLDEYLTSPDVSDFNRYIAECYVTQEKNGGEAVRPVPALSFHRKNTHLVYTVKNMQDYIPHRDDILPNHGLSSDSEAEHSASEV